jgi:Fic family protein
MEKIIKQIEDSKAELNAMRPLSPSLIAAVRQSYDLEITFSSNAIEGNTLTLRETKEVIEHGVTIGGKPLKDHLEAQDHHMALDYMYEMARGQELLSERIVKELNSLVVKRTQSDIAGRYSPLPRVVSGSKTVFPSPLKVPEMMEALARDLAKTEFTPTAAFEAHFRLTNIHPFADGNGRTARLLMNLILVRGGYQPVAVRVKDRDEYLDALEVASNDRNIKPFQIFMHQRLADTMTAYVSVLKEGIANQEVLDNDEKAKEAQGPEQQGLTAAQIAFYKQTRGRDRS